MRADGGIVMLHHSSHSTRCAGRCRTTCGPLRARFSFALYYNNEGCGPTRHPLEKAIIHQSLKEKDLDIFKDADNEALLRGGATYADAITFGDESVDPKLVEEFSKVKGKKTLPYNPESDLTDYLQLYSDLAK